MTNQILKEAQSELREIVSIRQDLHKNPETGYDLGRTAEIVEKYLKNLDVQVTSGVGRIGILGDIKVSGATKTIALRADMDALEMDELSEVSYKSKIQGKAHMCGHDAHTAMLLGAARVISKLKSQLKCNVRFIFQPSEEQKPSGALAMIKDGATEGIDQIYALHVAPHIEEGCFELKTGVVSSNTDFFRINIRGRGSHGADPHLSVDPVVLAAHFISQSQSIIARNIHPLEPGILTFAKINGGSTNNVIPENVIIEGTVRTYSEEAQHLVKERLKMILEGICNSSGAQYEFDYDYYCPGVINDLDVCRYAGNVVSDVFGKQTLSVGEHPSTGGEDFAYYSQKIPACMISLGTRNKSRGFVHECHSPYFDLSEGALQHGIVYHASLALLMG